MNQQFYSRIKWKKDSANNWEKNNPILLDGEIIIVVMNDNSLKIKVGDGTSHYKNLPFEFEGASFTGNKGELLGFVENNKVGAITNKYANAPLLSPSPITNPADGDIWYRIIT